MGFKQICKNGFEEFKRRSKIKKLKRKLTIKEREFSDELTLLGQKAWESKLDLSEYSDITKHIISSQNDLDGITKKKKEQEKQKSLIEQKRKSENENFNSQIKAIEAQKREVDLKLVELNKESREIQKEIDRIQDRLNQIKRDKEKLELKISDNQTTDEEKVHIEKKIQSIEEERNNLELKPEKLSKKKDELLESMMPFEDQSSKFQAKIDEIRKEQKTLSEKYDQELKKIQREISDCQEEQKKANREKIDYFHKLGKALFSSNFVNKSVNTELSTVRNASSEIKNQEMDIKSLEESGTPESKRALWKLSGLAAALFVVIVGVIFIVITISKPSERRKSIDIEDRIAISNEELQNRKSEKVIKKVSENHDKVSKNYQEKMEIILSKSRNISQKLKILYDEFEKNIKRSEPRYIDLKDIVNDYKNEQPEKLFEWVRDNTYFIPYKGLLRGAHGVLIDKKGNSLDRAILLSELLNKSGYRVQLVRGVLSETEVKDILQKVNQIPGKNSSSQFKSLSKTDLEQIEKYSQKFSVKKEIFFNAIEEVKDYRKFVSNRISKSVEKVVPQLMSKLEKIKRVNLSKDIDTILKSSQDHWWIQYKKDNDWVDLDPTLKDAVPGSTLTKSEKIIQLDDLDEQLIHKITLKVIIEQWKEGELKNHVVLNHTLKPQKLIGKRIMFFHQPADWPSEPNFFQNKEPAKEFNNLILNQNIWTPVLQVENQNILGSSFSNSGELSKKVKRKGRSKGAGGLFKGFSKTLTNGELNKKGLEQGSLLTGEWIEYEVYSPGIPVRRIRRQVFDLLWLSERLKKDIKDPVITQEKMMKRNLALLSSTEILPMCCYLNDEFVQHIANISFLANKKVIFSLLTVEKLSKPDYFFSNMSKYRDFNFSLHKLALARNNHKVYLNTPNIFSFHYLYEQKDDHITNIKVFDIVDNRIAVSVDNIEKSFLIRLMQGIFDSVAEAVFMTHKGEEDGLSKMYKKIEKENINWLTLYNSGENILESSELSDNVKILINRDLAKGFIIIVPEKAVTIDGNPVIKWWRIHPETGETLLIGNYGWGQAMVSYVEQVEIVMQLKGWIETVINILECAELTIIQTLGPGPESYTFLDCIAKLLCNQLYSEYEDYLDLETNWTNFIIKQLVSYLAGEFCDAFIDETFNTD